MNSFEPKGLELGWVLRDEDEAIDEKHQLEISRGRAHLLLAVVFERAFDERWGVDVPLDPSLLVGLSQQQHPSHCRHFHDPPSIFGELGK